jgi:hypothetical protein
MTANAMGMSTGRLVGSWCLVLLATALWMWWRVGSARQAELAAEQRLAGVQRQVARLAELRRQTQVAHGPRADADLVSRAQHALEGAGIPLKAFSSVQPQGDQQQVDGIHLQEVQLRLQGITPHDLGSWLKSWQVPGQPWVIQSMQATHANPTTENPDPDDNRFDVSLGLTTPYVEETP